MPYDVRTAGVPVIGEASTIATPTLLPEFGAPSTIEDLRDAVLELWNRMSVVAAHYQQTEYRFPERHLWETLESLNIFNMTHGGTLPSTRKDGTPLRAGDMHGDYSQAGIPLRPLIYDGENWVSFLLDIQPGGAMIDQLLQAVLINSEVVNAPNAALVDALRTELRGGVATDRNTLKKLSDVIDALTLDAENLAMTGIPTAPTAAPGTNSTQVATTAFAKAQADASAAAAIATGPLPAANLTGTIDVARLPILPSSVQIVSSGDLTALTSLQQAEIGDGSIVTTSDGRRWVYTGSGSKTSAGSYIELADITPDWTAVSGKPSTFPPETHNHGIGDVTGLTTALAGKQATLTGSEAQFLGFDAGGVPTPKSIRSSNAGNLLRTTALGTLELLASDLPGASGSIRTYANRAAATAELPGNLNTGAVVIVSGGDGGFFQVKLGNYVSTLAADPAQGLVFPVGATDGSDGIYERIWEQEEGLSADWFSIVPGTVNVTKWNQMIARLPGLQTRTIRLRAGTYVFPSKPSFPEVVDLWGAGLSLTYIERGYSEAGGNEVGFLDFTAELSRNSRLNHLTIQPGLGTTGGCMVKMATPTDVINSWCRWEHVLVTTFQGSYAVGVVVDGRANDVSGGQGHRDWVNVDCFIFPGTTGDAIRFYNATNGHHSGLWAGGNVIIDGGGTALQNTQDFAISGLRCLGTVVLRNCDKVLVSGVFQRAEIEATATRSKITGVDRGGGVSNLAPASCQVITQNGSYGNFIYEGTHDFVGPVILRGGVTVEDDTSPHPNWNFNYRATPAVQGGSIMQFTFNARDNKSGTPDFLTYAQFRAVTRDITDGSEDGEFAFDVRINGNLTTTWNFGKSIWYQTATGDDRGAGTINALEYYINGTKVVGARGSAVTAPTGGTTVDAESRTAINALISRLQAHGLIA